VVSYSIFAEAVLKCEVEYCGTNPNGGGILISKDIAYRWLHGLGYRAVNAAKTLYHDGHERSDVKDFLTKVYLPALAR
jgi:hypothetical protein